MGRVPGLATIDAHLHLRNGPGAAPGAPTDDVRAARQRGLIVAWEGDDRTHPDGGNQFFVRIVGRVGIVIKLPVVPAVGQFCRDLNALYPFYRPVPGPSGYEQADRRAVQMFEQLTVLGPGENGVRVQGFF